MLTWSLGKIVGGGGEKNWGQVCKFGAELVVVAGCEQGAEVGKEILRRINELYYGKEGGEVLQKLKGAVTRVKEEFGEAQIGVMSLVGEEIYLAVTAEIGVWVGKGEKEGWLVKVGPAYTEASAGKVVAMYGKAEEGEIVVMGNKKFWSKMGGGGIEKVKEGLVIGMEAAVEAAATLEQAGDDSEEGQAGAIVRMERGEVREENPKETAVAETAVSETPPPREIKKESRWREKLASMKEKIAARSPRNQVYVVAASDTDRGKKRRKLMYAGLGVLVMWMGLAGGGQIRQRAQKEQQSGENKIIETIQAQYQEASAVVGLNPTRSKELLAQIKQEMGTLGDKAKKDDRIVKINQGFGDVLGTATGVKTAEVREVVDLSLVRSDARGAAIDEGDGNKFWILDKDGNRLIAVDADKGSGEVTAGRDNLGQVKLIASYPGKVDVLSDKGIVQCDSTSNVCGVVVKSDEGWQDIAGMKVWAANVYLLDRGAKQIWKYSGSDSGLGARQSWLAGTDDSLSNSLSMAIDGNVWVLLKDGSIRKYAQGVGETITINGLDKAIGDGAVLYTDDNQDKLYILDPQNSRVLAIAKSGEYAMMWKSDKFASMQGFVADEKRRKMWLVGGKDVIEVQL